jgi:hypothetical protein
MLHVKRFERFFNRTHAPGLKIGVSLPYTFDGFPIILPFPLKSSGENVIQRGFRGLPVLLGIVVQLCVAFR